MNNSVELRAARWAAGDNTGSSSKAILRMMTGSPPTDRFCYPSDGGDLGRCIGLLDAVPEYRARMSEMKVVGPEWAALVDAWDELERMWRANDKSIYERMKKILDPIERTNPNLVRFGNGSSLYFVP